MAKRARKIAEKTVAIRDKMFPDLDVNDLWDRHKSAGFTTIPRTLAIVMNIIDDLTIGKPASKTYFALWARAFDEMYLSLQNADDLAYQSGFTGQRSVRVWRERMQALADLGFIKIADGPRGSLSHAVILNPHFAIRRLYLAGTAGLTKAAYNTLLERANDIGEKDMDIELPEDVRAKAEAAKSEALRFKNLDDEIPF